MVICARSPEQNRYLGDQNIFYGRKILAILNLKCGLYSHTTVLQIEILTEHVQLLLGSQVSKMRYANIKIKD